MFLKPMGISCDLIMAHMIHNYLVFNPSYEVAYTPLYYTPLYIYIHIPFDQWEFQDTEMIKWKYCTVCLAIFCGNIP